LITLINLFILHYLTIQVYSRTAQSSYTFLLHSICLILTLRNWNDLIIRERNICDVKPLTTARKRVPIAPGIAAHYGISSHLIYQALNETALIDYWIA